MGNCFISPMSFNDPTVLTDADPKDGAEGGGRVPGQHRHAHKRRPAEGQHVRFGYETNFDALYEKGRELGRGQFGITYAAKDKATGDKVAVKLVLKETLHTSVDVEDTKREVEILRVLKGHENVVQFVGSFEDNEAVYIVMELCEGGELLDRILSKRNRHYSEREAAKVVRQMLRVVARCHLFGVVHRDLKPENFLFKSKDEDSPLKAADFGLAEFLRPGRRFSNIVGSAYYIAPEVLKRRSGPEADVWSSGVISYILLCGRRPFWDKTEAGIFKEVLRARPDFREPPWDKISSLAKDFVRKLLNKDVKARLTAAQALSHPWVREDGQASDIPLDISVLSNLRAFVKYSRLKQLALRALATTLPESELVDLRDQFNTIDTNREGFIPVEDMKKLIVKNRPYKAIQRSDTRITDLIKTMDTHNNGLISFREFVAASMHLHQLEAADPVQFNQSLRQAFALLDRDQDGFLDPEELRVGLGIKGSIDDLLEEGDTDEDGKISFAEFERIVEGIAAREGEGSLVRTISGMRQASTRPYTK